MPTDASNIAFNCALALTVLIICHFEQVELETFPGLGFSTLNLLFKNEVDPSDSAARLAHVHAMCPGTILAGSINRGHAEWQWLFNGRQECFSRLAVIQKVTNNSCALNTKCIKYEDFKQETIIP